MTVNDHDFARKITAYLDRSAAELKAGTAYKLQVARGQALARLGDPKHAAQPDLALAGAGTATFGGRRGLKFGTRLGIGILVIMIALFGYQQWQAYQQLRDIEETDAAILASDLPIDAYLDRGFQNWLKRVSDED
jgi:Protein of unknown function (DUF3619)